MQVCSILPVPLQDLQKDNTYFIALWQVLKKSPEYMQFMKDRIAEGKFVFMDNGAAEGENPTVAELLPIAKELHPFEVILPDVPNNYDETLRQTREAYCALQQTDLQSDITYFAVPQGETFDRWKSCMKEFIRQPNIHTIGISKFVTPQFEKEFEQGTNVRLKCLEAIEDTLAEIQRTDVQVHLLGCWDDATEIQTIVQSPQEYLVRGCDSAFAYVFARAGKEYTEGAIRPDNNEIDFINGTVPDQELLKKNIDTWREVCMR